MEKDKICSCCQHEVDTKQAAELTEACRVYIAELRLSLARQKIRLGQKPSAVYSVCGFVDYNTFYRAYKKQFGHAPRDDFDTAENTANGEHSY